MKISGNAANDSTICNGDTVVFTATSGFANYNFKLNGTTVKYSAANTYSTDTLKDGDVVSVEVTSAFSCVASFNYVTMSVKPRPNVQPITGTTNVCVGSTTNLSCTPAGGVWGSSNNAVATIDASSGVITGITSGIVTISYTVTNGNGCSKTVTQQDTVNALPIVGTITGNVNICTGDNYS